MVGMLCRTTCGGGDAARGGGDLGRGANKFCRMNEDVDTYMYTYMYGTVHTLDHSLLLYTGKLILW